MSSETVCLALPIVLTAKVLPFAMHAMWGTTLMAESALNAQMDV